MTTAAQTPSRDPGSALRRVLLFGQMPEDLGALTRSLDEAGLREALRAQRRDRSLLRDLDLADEDDENPTAKRRAR